MKIRKSNLDERQEQTLLQIESKGFWLAFWGLLAAMVIQLFVNGYDGTQLIGEWIVFMILAIYVVLSCCKNGIWDRRLKPDPKTNCIISLIAAFAVGIVNFVVIFHNYPDAPLGAAAAGVFTAVGTFVMCMIALTIFASSYKKRLQKMEEEPDGASEEASKEKEKLS